MSNPPPNDPVVEEVREIRRRISEQFDHDPKRLVEHYIELQKRYADRLVGVSGKTGREQRIGSLTS